MELRIYDKSGNLRAEVCPDDNSTQQKAVMGDNALSVSFTTWEAIPFDIGDYVDYEGERYTLLTVPCPNQASTLEYEYAPRFQGIESELSKALCFLLTDGDMDSDFSLTDGPAAHLRLIVDNINRVKGTMDWRIGSVIAADYKVVTYDGIDCLTALNRIAETFETEWWIVGTTLYLGKCEHGEPLVLGYAADGTAVGGLLGMSRRDEENERFFTRLYAKGSTRNIDRSRYGSDRLRLPSPLRFLERNTEYGIVEREVIFEGIYPRRTGTLSGVRSIERESEGKTIRVYYVTDKDIPFDPNDHEIGGLTKRVVFQTGELSGYDLEVNYDSSTKEFELINQYPDENTQIPGGVMSPEAGDTYILYNIRMPDEYYTLAEEELRETADAYLSKYSVDSAVYSGDSDPIILKKRGIHVSLGQRVRLHNPVFFPSTGYRDSRIIGFTRKLADPYDMRIDISDTVTPTWRESIERKVDSFLPMLSQAGGAINPIRSGDDTVPTDNNVFSALRAISTFLRKDRPDETRYLMRFLGGLVSDDIESQDFTAGPFGSGFVVKRDPKTGKSYIEADEIYIRMKAYFDTLEIKRLSHVGGRIVLSPASMECIRVEEVSAEYEDLHDRAGSILYDSGNDRLRAAVDGGERAYRCYFKQTDGEREIVNEFAVDDLAQCREFNVKEGTSQNVSNQYYWRRVIHVGEDYIDLSTTDRDTGSMIPRAGDTIVTVGNKTNAARRHVVFLSSYDDDAPCIKLYSGIDSYSMAGKEVTVISPNADKNVFTGKMVIKPGSTGFGNLTDAPDMTAIDREIREAKDAAADASKEASDVRDSVGSLKGYVDGAFADGLVSEAEAKAIEKYVNVVSNERQQALATYNGLYNNPYLEGSAKTSLYNAKVSLFSATDALVNAINAAIADGKATAAEKAYVDSKYATFTTCYNKFQTAVETANQSIQDKLKGYSDNAQKAADEANNTASQAMEGANAAKDAVSDLNRYVDGAFADGLVSEAEAKAIEKYINMVNASKREADATYTALYANPFLAGTEKSVLYAAKNSLNTATTNLIAAINSAIADGKATTTEKNNVDSKFAAFNNAYASLATAIENANKAIQRKIKQEAIDESKSDLSQQIGEVSLKDRNDIAKMMGYKDYEELVYYAERGMSVIKGGSVNTSLINADLIITSALIAKAIRTNTLNVNDRFKIHTDGSVEMDGVFHSLGPNTELILSNGYVRITHDGIDVARLSVNNGTPELNLSKGGRSAVVTPGSLTLRSASGKFVTFSADDLNRSGKVFTNDDGVLRVAEQDYEILTCFVSVSPTGGGTTVPEAGGYLKRIGTSEYIEAIPADGYEFVRWSDNGSRRHMITWGQPNNSFTAYFSKIQVERFTLSLSVSPSGGGSVTGAGSYEKGTKVTVNATEASGWRFIRWSDGGYQRHTVTMDANKSLTAYFERYTVTGDEILQGTDLTSTSYWNAYGNSSVQSVSGGVATLRFGGEANTDQVMFNKGRMGGKLEMGHRYRLSFQARTSSGTTNIISAIGDNSFDFINTDDVIYGEEASASYKTFSVEFRADRDSTSGDGLLFTAISACVLQIRNITLKEA